MDSGQNRPAGELTLRELARVHRGSARLRNALEAADLNDLLPFRTVGEYLASPNPTAIMCERIRSIGRRTASELDRMVRDLSPVGRDAADTAASDPTLFETALDEIRVELARISLSELLLHLPHGTRLWRVLGASVGRHPVSQVIGHPEVIRAEALGMRSIGSATLDELVAETRLGVSKLIREAGRAPAMHDALMAALFGDADGPSWRIGGPPAMPGEAARALVLETLAGMNCASAFAHTVVPLRLARLVGSEEVGALPLAEALFDHARLNAKMARTPNVSGKTIRDFWDVCWRQLAIALVRSGTSDSERASVAALLRVDAARLEASLGDLAEYGLSATLVGDASDCAGIPHGLEGLVEHLLERIKPQDAAVIRRRFGLQTGRGETLEEIGLDLGVTRERVRQLEKRGLADLRVTSGRFGLRAALDADWERAWTALADGDDLVTDQEFAAFKKDVPGAITLSLELLAIDLAAWLSDVSQRYPYGWLAPHRDRTPVDEAIADVGGMPEGRPLPRAIQELGLLGAQLDVEAALLIGRGHRILHGYLVDGHIGPRRRRSLVSHAVLSRTGDSMLLVDLLDAYREAVPADWCSSRDLTMVMCEAPHLFLEISEGRWRAVGIGGQIPPGGRRREPDAAEEASSEPDVTVASAIMDELKRGGPQPLSALMESPRRYLPRDRSHNSIQPTVFTRSDLFARLLPGVYGLWSQVPTREEVLFGNVPYLLDETQARVFAMARRAGEPWGVFPLWSPEAEYRLCRWALREGSPEARRSLLAMATPDDWPPEVEERANWRKTCAREGRYDLVATLRPNVFAVRPDLDRVLAALIDLETAGRTSWMALNRVDGRHVASQLGCALLAILVLCGAAVAPDRGTESAWQLPHRIGGGVEELKSALLAELHERGTLAWSSDAGRRVAARVLEGEGRAPEWLPFRRFSELFRSMEPGPAEPVEVTVEAVGEAGGALLAQRRLTHLLDWLDAL